VVFPWLTLPFLVIVTVFLLVDYAMNRGVLETRKLESSTKSPVLVRDSSCYAIL
jgi:hypothetical protein